ncbi:hypothetical protein, partial [uncultured Ferrimonas sp.]|uniref:hypothetical protein n=1 Tax=uncultured Ferrimonas sp. TaxID=432640 RepID=UPI0026185847
RIRTIEGSAIRFTIWSLWPLGNPSTSAAYTINFVWAVKPKEQFFSKVLMLSPDKPYERFVFGYFLCALTPF